MATVARRKAFQENEQVVREGYRLLRTVLHDTPLGALVDKLEESHLSTLQQLETTGELYVTLDLNLRSALERAGA